MSLILQLLGLWIPFFSLVVSGTPLSDSRVTIRVVTPAGTPDSVTVFVAGNLPVLGSWNPAAVACLRESDSTWAYSFSAPRGTDVEFKVTLGSWDTEAIYGSGQIPGNTRLVVRGDTVITLRPVTWRNMSFSIPGGVTGTVRYHRGFEGAGLNYSRDLIVWLPPSYELEKRRHPVLYMHDGQNLFDPSTSFKGIDWRIDEIADSLIRAGAIDDIIVVGITNTPDRTREYSDSPLGRSYAQFIIHTVKPFIDSTYRTMPGRDHTAVMGSSMGGLISFLFVWWHPEVFSAAGCVSSAFLFDNNKILHDVMNTTDFPADVRIYLDCGTEQLDENLRPGYEAMVELLRKKGLKEGSEFVGFLAEGAGHDEAAWAARVWRPLVFMFPLR